MTMFSEKIDCFSGETGLKIFMHKTVNLNSPDSEDATLHTSYTNNVPFLLYFAEIAIETRKKDQPLDYD